MGTKNKGVTPQTNEDGIVNHETMEDFDASEVYDNLSSPSYSQNQGVTPETGTRDNHSIDEDFDASEVYDQAAADQPVGLEEETASEAYDRTAEEQAEETYDPLNDNADLDELQGEGGLGVGSSVPESDPFEGIDKVGEGDGYEENTTSSYQGPTEKEDESLDEAFGNDKGLLGLTTGWL